jgi:hypothetical protein
MLALVPAAPVAAQDGAAAGSVDADVARVEAATSDLVREKRAAAGAVDRLAREAAPTLRRCGRRGRGWRHLRAISHPSQRSLYLTAARRLMADMRTLVLTQQPLATAYGPAFGRFVGRLEAAGVSDPLLGEAVAAQARRLASYRDLRAVRANCRVFNRVLRRAREFPTRTAREVVRADYRSGPVARRIERHVDRRLRRIDRRHRIGDRDLFTLERAAALIEARGGSPGLATAFRYGLSLR